MLKALSPSITVLNENHAVKSAILSFLWFTSKYHIRQCIFYIILYIFLVKNVKTSLMSLSGTAVRKAGAHLHMFLLASIDFTVPLVSFLLRLRLKGC